MITWLFLLFLLVLILIVGAFLIAAYVSLKRQIGEQVKMVDGKVGDVRGEVRTLGMVSETELERLKAIEMRQDSHYTSTTKMFKNELRRVDGGMAKLADDDVRLNASLATVGQQIQQIEAQYADVRKTIETNMEHLAKLERHGARNKEEIVKIAEFLYEAARHADELMGILESVFSDFERRIVAVEGADLPRKLAELSKYVEGVDAAAKSAMDRLIARLDARGEVAGELKEQADAIGAIRDRLMTVETSEQAASAEVVRSRLADLETRLNTIDAVSTRLATLESNVAKAQAEVQKTINSLKVSKLQIGDKWSLSGVGDGLGNDEWLRLMDAGGKDYYGGFAARKLWSGEGVSAESGVDVRGTNPGPLVQKKYGANDADRYGVAQKSGGETHIYAANAHGPSAVHMSFATGKDTYDSVLIAEKNKASGDKQVTVRGKMSVAQSMCVDDGCVVGGAKTAAGRMHIHAPEKIYLLPKGGVELTADWNAEPTFVVRSGFGKTGKLCIDDQCITKADLARFKAL